MLLGLYEFGSHARGDADESSDYDVLAVVSGSHVESVEHLLPESRRGIAAVSWYGVSRLRAMFAAGDLFAWHLFLEATPILEQGFALKGDGQPQPYCQAREDILSFRDIMAEIPDRVATTPKNSAYEFGLFYVSARNIAMSASAELLGKPDFSRMSPFYLPPALSLPITRNSYELAMQCRMASQRGAALGRRVEAEEVMSACNAGLAWSEMVLTQIEERSPC